MSQVFSSQLLFYHQKSINKHIIYEDMYLFIYFSWEIIFQAILMIFYCAINRTPWARDYLLSNLYVSHMPKEMLANTRYEIIFGFYLSRVLLLERSFNAEMLRLFRPLLCDPLQQPLVRLIPTRYFESYHTVPPK